MAELKKLTLKMKDEELITGIKKRISDATPLHTKILDIGKENENYWRGTQLDEDLIADYRSKIMDNRIFTAIETQIPIITRKPIKPTVMGSSQEDISKQMAQILQGVLLDLYRTLKMRTKTRTALRHLILYRLGVMKWFWDIEKDDVGTNYVRPQRIKIDPQAMGVADAAYVQEEIYTTVDKAIELFPDSENDIKEMAKESGTDLQDVSSDDTRPHHSTSGPQKVTGTQKKDQFIYQEFWTDEFVVEYAGKILLRKRPNPFFDFEGGQNHFDRPRKPFVFLQQLNLGQSPYSDTDLIQQTKSLQDGINKRKQQISDNADEANGVLLIDSALMSLEEAEKLDMSPDSFIHGPDVLQSVSRLSGTQLPTFVFEDMLHSTSEVDNVFGTHAVSRGEREGKETATGRLALKESDSGRTDPLSEAIELAYDDLYNGWTQLIKMNYTGMPKYFNRLGVEFGQDQVEDGVLVEVEAGSAIPEDQVAISQRAIQLASSGMIDPISLFEDMRVPNPQERAQRLFLWNTAPQQLLGLPEPAAQQLERTQEAIAKTVEVDQRFLQGPEFANMSPEEKQAVVDMFREKAKTLGQTQ